MTIDRTTSRRQLRTERQHHTNELLQQASSADLELRTLLIEEVIVDNLPVARAIAQRYHGRGIDSADLEQVACLALVLAAQRFDPERSEDFLTYAVPTIRGELQRWFRDRGWTVRPPRAVQDLQHELLRIEAETGALPPLDELARRTGSTVAEVREALDARGCFSPTSLDVPVGETDSRSAATTLGDLLSIDDGGMDRSTARIVLRTAIARLSPEDRRVLRMRFVEDRTQAEIGLTMGVSQTQISRILARILTTLRAEMGGLADVA